MSTIKALARVVGLGMAMPYLVGYALLRLALGPQRAFGAISECISKIGAGVIGVYARQGFYRCLLGHVGQDVHFGFMALFSKRETTIGDRVYIGRYCIIGYAKIEDDVMIADQVQVLSGRHQHGSQLIPGQTMRDNPHQYTQVTIGRGAWLGAGAVVMADVGPNAVVGAGAVVVKPVAAGQKVGGVPAKPLKQSTPARSDDAQPHEHSRPRPVIN